MRIRALLVLLFLLPASFCLSQNQEWFALSDFSYLVNVEDVQTDQEGNCYAAGKFQGEAAFQGGNAADSAIGHYTSEHWHKSFIAKYTSEGKISYVLILKSMYGNSDLTYIKGIKCLRNGDLLVALYCRGDFYFIDADGVKHDKLRHGLLRISRDGKLVWSIPFPLGHYTMLEQDDQENIFIYTDEHRHYSDGDVFLFRLDGKGTIKDKTHAAKLSAVDMKFSHGKLWLILRSHYDKQSKNFPLKTGEAGLFSVVYKDSVQVSKHFSYPLQTNDAVSMILNENKGNMTVEMLAGIRQNTFTFAGKQFDRLTGEGLLMKIDHKGKLVRSRQFKGLSYYNYGLAAGTKGGVYLYTPVHKKIYFEETDSLFAEEHSSQYVQELFFFRLDKDYKVKWHVKGGGTASNYHRSFIRPYKDSVYLISDLLDYGTFLGKYRSLKWKSGYYVEKMVEKTD
ncbi:MAG: hypothetical protein ACJ75J_05885 [Cytophagaceae bacterium]